MAGSETHNHRLLWLRRATAMRANDRPRRMGPCVRRDDMLIEFVLGVVPAKAGTHNHRLLWLRRATINVPNRGAAAYGSLRSQGRRVDRVRTRSRPCESRDP